jgi:hypothetical protein
MKRFVLAVMVAGAVLVATVATVAAADRLQGQARAQERDGGTLTEVLGLTQAQIMEQRQQGLSLADIAVEQDVDVDAVVNALTAQWTARIQARLEAGALTADEAAQLRVEVTTRAQEMVQQTAVGGMRGAAVGAGPAAGAGAGAGQGPMGSGNGTGTCDGSGPHGAGRS